MRFLGISVGSADPRNIGLTCTVDLSKIKCFSCGGSGHIGATVHRSAKEVV